VRGQKARVKPAAKPVEAASGESAAPVEETSSPVDRHVGARIRLRRTLVGLSQMALGERLGVSFQQVQKYERGSNRVSASTLYRLGEVLDVPVSFFFDDMAGESQRGSGGEGVLLKRETLELVRAYYRIEEEQRAAVLSLLRSMGRDRAEPEVV
jgi:transcriptional regulator with XRE-family HTH domain